MLTDLVGSLAAIATPHVRAADAASDALNGGGNAVDAAVAAVLALCVLQPYNVSLGGYGGAMLVYRADHKSVSAIDFDSRAPLAFKPELYAQHPDRANHGALAVCVPAIVAGLDLALRELGTKRWADVSAHALKLAEEGFDVNAALSGALGELKKHADPISLGAILPTGRVPAVRERWVQKDLAGLLRQLSDNPAAFYSGKIPKTIVRQLSQQGGILSEEDFARYRPQVVKPIHMRYRGHEVFTPPPPAGGLTTLSILQTLEQFDLSRLQHWGAPYFELFAESAKLCWEERRQYLGDPAFVNVPIERLLSQQMARERADRVRHGPWATSRPMPPVGTHTVNVVVVDKARNLVSLTATMGDTFGSRVAIAGLGLPLGHGMSRFTWPAQDPHSPNSPAPGKRMQHNMSPVIVLNDGKPRAAVGMPGGTRIVTVTAQLAISLIDFGATPAQAVFAPRVHTDGGEPLLLSDAVSEEVARELELMGHKVKRRQPVGGAANVAVLSDDLSKVTVAGGAPAGVMAVP